MHKWVATLTDKLGMPIDPRIFETVVVLNLLGLHTFQSCEEHLDHRYPYPWVTIIDEERSRTFNRRWLAVCEAGLLLLTAVWIIYEAIRRLLYHEGHVDPSIWQSSS